MTQPLLVFHEEHLCQCDIEQCSCPCHACQGYRTKQFELHRLADLENKLASMGIEMADLTALVWHRIQHQVELVAFEAVAVLCKQQIYSFISQEDLKEKLAELLFQDMVDVALGVHEGANRNDRNTQGAGSTHRGGQERACTGS